MATIYRTRIALSGWEGGPGVNTVMWTGGFGGGGVPSGTDVDTWHSELLNAWSIMGGYCRDNFKVQVEPTVDMVDVATGQIVGVVTDSGAPKEWTQGTATISKVPTASMACVALLTDTWANGRRLQGRYFIGPLNIEGISEEGSMTDTAREDIQDALYASYTGLGARLAVYSRPTRGQANGYYGDVTQALCRKPVSVLRSRRN